MPSRKWWPFCPGLNVLIMSKSIPGKLVFILKTNLLLTLQAIAIKDNVPISLGINRELSQRSSTQVSIFVRVLIYIWYQNICYIYLSAYRYLLAVGQANVWCHQIYCHSLIWIEATLLKIMCPIATPILTKIIICIQKIVIDLVEELWC